MMLLFFFFSSRRRHTRWPRDWSSDVCSSDLAQMEQALHRRGFDEEVITTVLGEFDDAGLIDDRAFAKAWVSSRHHSREIGRASCRERVEIAVVGGILKKKKDSKERRQGKRVT